MSKHINTVDVKFKNQEERNQALSGLEYFTGGDKKVIDDITDPMYDYSQEAIGFDNISRIHQEAAKGVIQVLTILMQYVDTNVTNTSQEVPVLVLIKHIDIDPSGKVIVDFISTDRRFPEHVLAPHVIDAISIQLNENVNNIKQLGLLSKIKRYLKGLLCR